MAKRTAVIDIGSNSVRMVIFEKTSRFAFHLLHEAKSRVRISEHAYDNNGNLQPKAMERALGALGEFLSIAESYNVRKILCCATSAVRDAPNRSLFVNRVKRELGIAIKVIDGNKEAYLGGIAAANLLPKLAGVTVDIGGGSTEIARLENGMVLETYSLNLGTVRLKEMFFDRGDIAGATAYIDAALQELPADAVETVIGVGGTFRALAQAIMDHRKYPLKKLHGYTFEAKAMRTLGEKILKSDENDFKKLGIKKERFDVIKPGVLILLRLLERLQTTSLVASGVGVREGLFLSDLLRHARHRFPENFNPSVRYLQDNYVSEGRFANLYAQTAERLFELLHAHLGLERTYGKELSVAARLAKIGMALHYYSYRQHSYYLSQTALEYGFTHREITLISTLLRYQKQKTPSKAFMEKYKALLPDAASINTMTFILALSDLLLCHRPRNADFTLSFSGDTLHVTAEPGRLYLAREQFKGFELPEGMQVLFS